jgi:simple sugar transport system substrate-binding protein
MIRMEGFGAKVPDAVRREVLARERDIASGRLRPFAGPIEDNRGRLIVPRGASLTDAQIQTMDFLVSGVQGSLPK